MQGYPGQMPGQMPGQGQMQMPGQINQQANQHRPPTDAASRRSSISALDALARPAPPAGGAIAQTLIYADRRAGAELAGAKYPYREGVHAA